MNRKDGAAIRGVLHGARIVYTGAWERDEFNNWALSHYAAIARVRALRALWSCEARCAVRLEARA